MTATDPQGLSLFTVAVLFPGCSRPCRSPIAFKKPESGSDFRTSAIIMRKLKLMGLREVMRDKGRQTESVLCDRPPLDKTSHALGA